MNPVSTEASSMSRWIGWTVIFGGGVAVFVTDAVVGIPLAGWRGALAASIFSGSITALLASVFTHGQHPRT